MPFTPAIKTEAKKKSHYKCCLCETWEFVEVHHITPEADEGPNTLDNAAPLCVRCHDAYGSNPEKRKWIREKRDLWWDICDKRISEENKELFQDFGKIVESYESKISSKDETVKQLNEKVDKLVTAQYELFNAVKTGETPSDEIYVELGIAGSAVLTSSNIISSSGSYTNFEDKS